MAVGDIFKLAVVGRFGTGQQFVNTFHFRQILSGGTNPAQDLAQGFEQQAMAEYLDLISNAYVVDTIEVRQKTGTPLFAYDEPSGASGVITGDPLPPQVSPLISWRTAEVGRRNRGRSYIPAPAEVNQNAGVLTAGYLALVQSFADEMLTINEPILGNPEFELVIFHDIDDTATTVTEGIPRPTLMTQRRRRVGVGS